MKCRNQMTGMAMALVALTLAGASLAQGRGGPGGPGGPGGGRGGARELTAVSAPVNSLTTVLNLTTDQVASIQKIQTAYRSAMKSAMPQPGSQRPDASSMKAAMEKVQALDKTYSAQIVAVLSDSQKTALTAYLKEQNAYRTVGIPAEIVASLNLTADQKASILAIASKAQKAIKALTDSASTSSDPRASGRQMMQIRQNAHTEAMAVLTEAQQALVTKASAKQFGSSAGAPPDGQNGAPSGPPPDGQDGGQMGTPPDGQDGGQMGPPPDDQNGGQMGTPPDGQDGAPPAAPDGGF